jgi:hypothetical protein
MGCQESYTRIYCCLTLFTFYREVWYEVGKNGSYFTVTVASWPPSSVAGMQLHLQSFGHG